MINNAIILHGGPSKKEYYDPEMPSMSNSHFIPWLQAQLLKNEITAHTPEVPHSFDRNWTVWQKEINRFEINPNTLLVGHSTGAGFFVKYLSINKNLNVEKLMLVAPWIDPKHEKTKNFFDDFEIDSDLSKRVKDIVIFVSDNDEPSVLESVDIIKSKISIARVISFPGYGHFCVEDMQSTKFPELLEECLR
ncbi:MAG: alpha/beta hydrolase [Patescibacteria group bacterium]